MLKQINFLGRAVSFDACIIFQYSRGLSQLFCLITPKPARELRENWVGWDLAEMILQMNIIFLWEKSCIFWKHLTCQPSMEVTEFEDVLECTLDLNWTPTDVTVILKFLYRTLVLRCFGIYAWPKLDIPRLRRNFGISSLNTWYSVWRCFKMCAWPRLDIPRLCQNFEIFSLTTWYGVTRCFGMYSQPD